MNYRNLGNKAHTSVHFLAIAGIAVGLPFSKAVMSIGMMLAILNLLIEANFKDYRKNLKDNKAFYLIASLYLIHVIALIWTSDWNYALNDLRVKLPLVVIPAVLFARPIDNIKSRDLILHLFLISLLSTSLYNYLAYQGIIGNYAYNDIRGLSLFGSHIRYGILIAFGAMISLWYIVNRSSFKAYHTMIFIWFVYYTYYSQIISGLLALSTGIVAIIFLFLFERKRIWAYAFSFLIISLPILGGFLLLNGNNTQKQHVDPSKLPERTAEGNPYVHSMVEQRDTKGNYLFINLCEEELRREWNKVSSIHYDSLDIKGQKVSFTLIRYMTSLGLMKDAEGFKHLKEDDLRKIESGIAEYGEGKSGFIGRLTGIRFQLQGKDDPNGYSLLQRLEYWKTGLHILSENWLIGVGTGDVKTAFDQQYEKDHSPLYPENRLRAHNSYLTFWITFGIAGFLLFIYLIISYLKDHLSLRNSPAFIFMMIAAATFLLEDTLETQTGVTFFAFFYAFFTKDRKD
jgi:hypothetical protein